MTLVDFVREQKELLDQFRQDLVIQAAQKREVCPDNLVPGAWDEQFKAYKQSRGYG